MAGVKGTSKAQTHELFRQRLRELRQSAEKLAQASRGQGTAPWNIPTNLQAQHLFDIPSLHKGAFNRDAMNANYAECFQDVADMGTTGDVIALKQQIDYIACEERAFRFRHASVCRLMAHAASRQRGHGIGNTFTHIEKQVADCIKAGAS